MSSLTDVFVTVKPDMDKFGPEVKKKLARIDAAKEGKRVGDGFGKALSSSFTGFATKAGAILAGGLAVAGVVGKFKEATSAVLEQQKLLSQTNAVLKSTGNAAGVTSKSIVDLSNALEAKSTIDAESIQNGENLLLTFTNLQNKVGKGNDIFNQATQIMTDMSTALGQDTKASAIQLGKALNDPIKGVTALQKVGVSFTEDQKKQIKTLQESGNVMGAQKVILAELNKEFGGSAAAAGKTTAGQFKHLKDTIDGMFESVVSKALPVVLRFADFLSTKAAPAVSAFAGDMSRTLGPVIKDVFGFFRTEVLPRLQAFAGFVASTVIPAVSGFAANLAGSLGPTVKDVFGFFKAEVIPRLKDFGGFLGGSVLPKVGQLATSLSKNKDFLVPFAATIVTIIAALKTWAIVQGILNAVMSANPIGLVVIAIAALVGGLVYAYKHSEKFKSIVDAAFKVVAAAGQFMWNAVLKPMFALFATTLKFIWGQMQFWSKVSIGAFNAIKGPAVTVLRFLVGRMLDFVGNMLTAAAKAFGWVPKLGGPLKNAAAEFNKFRDKTNAALNGIDDQTITIKPVFDKNTMSLASAGRRASGGPGGPVDGPGTTTSDTAGLYALSRKEWVIKAASSMKYGDYAMRSVNEGTATIIPDGGFARGGSPRLNVRAQVPSDRQQNLFAGGVAAHSKAIGQSFAGALAKLLGVNPGLTKVLSFVKSQVGKPYVWGGVGPGGYDCSGLVSAAINTAFGRSPYRRLGATGSMPWSSFASGPGAFEVGWFQGNPGHTAATVNGVHIESAGGVGVRMGAGARGARDSLFTHRAHVKGFADGGLVGDAPYDTLHNKKRLMKELGIDLFDRGGRWKSGTIAANMSGRDEHVIPDPGQVELGLKTINAIADAVAARPTILNERRVDEGFARVAMRRGY